MRSYRQYCAMAKALDVIGDRWSLLIVRELMLSGSSRYTDLLQGLPGIATNLLADRLKDLEEGGVIKRELAPPPVATTLFSLTPRGEGLRAVVSALGLWGGPLLMAGPKKDDEFQSHWLALPITEFFPGKVGSAPVTIEVRTGDEPLVIETIDGRVRTRRGTAKEPDLVLTGRPEVILPVLRGRIDIPAARRSGLKTEGDPKVLSRLRSEAGIPA